MAMAMIMMMMVALAVGSVRLLLSLSHTHTHNPLRVLCLLLLLCHCTCAALVSSLVLLLPLSATQGAAVEGPEPRQGVRRAALPELRARAQGGADQEGAPQGLGDHRPAGLPQVQGEGGLRRPAQARLPRHVENAELGQSRASFLHFSSLIRVVYPKQAAKPSLLATLKGTGTLLLQPAKPTRFDQETSSNGQPKPRTLNTEERGARPRRCCSRWRRSRSCTGRREWTPARRASTGRAPRWRCFRGSRSPAGSCGARTPRS